MKKGKKNLTCVFQLHIKNRMKQSTETHLWNKYNLPYICKFCVSGTRSGKGRDSSFVKLCSAMQKPNQTNKNTQRIGAVTP